MVFSTMKVTKHAAENKRTHQPLQQMVPANKTGCFQLLFLP